MTSPSCVDPTVAAYIVEMNVPPHPDTAFDEPALLGLVAHSPSMSLCDKLNTIVGIAALSQKDVDRLLAFLHEERERLGIPAAARHLRQRPAIQGEVGSEGTADIAGPGANDPRQPLRWFFPRFSDSLVARIKSGSLDGVVAKVLADRSSKAFFAEGLTISRVPDVFASLWLDDPLAEKVFHPVLILWLQTLFRQDVLSGIRTSLSAGSPETALRYATDYLEILSDPLSPTARTWLGALE